MLFEKEWSQNQFASDIYIVDKGEQCSTKFDDGEPLFTYNWPGLRSLHEYTYDYQEYYKSDTKLTIRTGVNTGK